jgi:phosphopantothenoylcysteine decarboxylase/phosphopantothenate--cysteine ligase
MAETVLEELSKGYDILISAAAISDFTVTPAAEKIKSGKVVTLTLRPAPKLIRQARQKYPHLKIVGFKAETNVTEDELIERARESMESSNLSMVVANDISKGGMGAEENDVYIIDSDVKHISGTKRYIAAEIMDKVEAMF